MNLIVIPPFHSSGDAKIGKEDIHSSFKAMILWNNVRRLMLKMEELEGIDAHAVPPVIVLFTE